MEKRLRDGKPTAYFSMVGSEEVIKEVKKLAKSLNMSLSAYVENLMRDAIDRGGETSANSDLDIKNDIVELKQKMAILNDKIDCLNIMITKMTK